MENIAYLAGLFDGEGSCSIQIQRKPRINFNHRMTMSIKYGHEVLSELVKEFGGKIYYYDDNMARWHLGKKQQMIRAIKLMLPYLKIKKQVCLKFLKALEYFPDTRSKNYWNKEKSNKVIDIAVHLNPQSSQKRFKYNI